MKKGIQSKERIRMRLKFLFVIKDAVTNIGDNQKLEYQRTINEFGSELNA